MNFKLIVKTIEKFTIDNSPLLLTAVGVTGVITTAVLAGKASYKAAILIVCEEEQQAYDENIAVGFLTSKEKVKLVWPLFIPPLVSAAITVTCIIGSNRIGTRRAAAMAAAYSLSEKAFDEYREKIVEKLGENKERAARDELAQERVDRNPVGRNEVIITGGGDVLCYDTYTGRYFKSDMETLKKAQNDLNYQMLNQQYASLNDFYNRIGLPNVKTGEEVGWNADKLMELMFSTTMSDDQRPCISIDFEVTPVRNYFRSH